MFRTKKDVDRHVQDIFRKLKNEDEINLRYYNVAKLYYQVGDYESAKRYVSSYLEVREGSSGARKLLGQTLEALGQKEGALAQYKISLELDSKQTDLVLKVCEVLADMDSGADANKIKYWVERVDRLFPRHPIVFQLKEKMLMSERSNDNSEDLEALIASELSVRPTDIHLQVKMIKYYMSKNRLDDAYNHAINVESTYNHRNSIIWYQSLSELLTKCKENKQSDWTFWVLYISSLERYAALSLREQGNELATTVSQATQAVFIFDQTLTEIKSKNFPTSHFIEQMLMHMWGQLHFHMACLLIRKTRREQGSWNEISRLCAILLLSALHVQPVDPTALWAIRVKDLFKNLICVWFREGSYRCSQAGHILQDYARDNIKKLMKKIDTFCTGSWRERIYQRIFISRLHQQVLKNSYFVKHVASNPPLRLLSYNELKRYDEISEEIWPDSLHHHVWLGIKSRSYNSQNKSKEPYPHQTSHVFSDLQFSVYDLNQASPDTLSQLDIDAFLNATVLCSSVIIEDQKQKRGFLNPDRMPTLPADLTNSLCTIAQEKWWSSAYKIYSKQEALEGDIGEVRQELQQGLEVIRCIGNHGLHPVVIVHLARIFRYRLQMLQEKDKQHNDIPALEARCELYWSIVIPLLERLQNNQTICMTNSKLFNYEGKDMSNAELTHALEEGKLFLVQRFLRDKQHEQAIEALQALKCPEASFQQGQIYKMLADEIVSFMPKESLTSEIRSQHISMLAKARNSLYLTLDRLRSPGTNPKHPLNSELVTHILDIENELKRIDPDIWQADLSTHECDELSDESYSSTHSCVDQPISNVPMTGLTGLNSSVNVLSTPQRNTHRLPKQASTPYKFQHQDILDLSLNRTEARPSPERLDAQIRQIMHSRDTIMQSILEQNKTILELNKTMMEKIEELTKELAELRKDIQKQRTQSMNFNTNLEDDLYVLGEEDYNDLNYPANQAAPTSSISGTMFPPTHRHPYSPLVYPPATVFQGYYQGSIPFSDPNAATIPPLYSPNVYPMPVLYPNRSRLQDTMLQQTFFTSRLSTQLPDLMPSTNPPMQVPPQKVEVSKADIVIKDAPVNKVPPVNVVITTSDTLPTTAPLVQPTLSVTIPAHYRLGTVVTAGNTEQPNIPHCYQISMPSQATIPTTVNLPPLSTSFITTPVNISSTEVSKAATHDTSSANNSNEVQESENDPIPDFVPVIPLPAEVKVTTGEEDETTLYSGYAKLLRFVDKEWKERGIGNVKLLRNAEGKVRLLMRRDQILKICANHMLKPDMELTSMKNNNKVWIWVANDFADEKVKLETFCIKFKTEEEARSFKEHFDKAKSSLSQSPEKSSNNVSSSVTTSGALKSSLLSTSEGMLFKQTLDSQKSSEAGTVARTVCPGKEVTHTATVVGGFSFSSKPIIQEVSAKTEKIVQKNEESKKVNPFVEFSFNKTDVNKSLEVTKNVVATTLANTSTTVVLTQASSPFSLNITTVTSSHAGLINTSTTTTTDTVTTVSSQTPQAAATSRTSLRRPHALPPTSVTTTVPSVTESSSHKSETVLSEQIATLHIYNESNQQWECRGKGQMKILLNSKKGKLSLLMYNEENAQICYNRVISAETNFVQSSSETGINWCIQDNKQKNKTELFEATFQTAERALEFLRIIYEYQQKLIKNNIRIDAKKSEVKKGFEKPSSSHAVVPDKTQIPLSELFKPAAKSWECTECLVRNNDTAAKCVACESLRPTLSNTKPKDEIPSSNNQSIESILNSWKCTKCHIFNSNSDDYCITCDTAKNPSMPPKIKESGFNISTFSSEKIPTFTFGIPQAAAKEAPTGFKFQMAKPDDKAVDDVMNSENSYRKNLFDMAQLSKNTLLNKEPVFGSTNESFGFNFQTKPVKSSDDGDEGNEEVEQSEDIHFSPVIPLPDEIEIKTGEEDEEIVYSHKAKLFRFDSTAKEWKERGLGDIKLLKHKESNKFRLVMRRDQILKLCLNHIVSPTLEFTAKDEKTWLWCAADYSDGELKHMQLACRFKTSEIAADFKQAIDNAKELIKTLNNEHAEQLEQHKKASSSQDIEIIYEFKVTPEEKAAALKLQLPQNFYSYKQKADCPGCLGCENSTISLFEDVSQKSSSSLKAKGTKTDKMAETSVVPATSSNISSYLTKEKFKNSSNDNVTNVYVSETALPVPKVMVSPTSPSLSLKPSTLAVSGVLDKVSIPFSLNKNQSTSLKEKETSSYFSLFGTSSIQSNTNEKLTPSGIIGQPSKSLDNQRNLELNWLNENQLNICSPSSLDTQQSISTTLNAPVGNIFNKTQSLSDNIKLTTSIFETGPIARTSTQSTLGNNENQIFGNLSKTSDSETMKSAVNPPTSESIFETNASTFLPPIGQLNNNKMTSSLGNTDSITVTSASIFGGISTNTKFSGSTPFSTNSMFSDISNSTSLFGNSSVVGTDSNAIHTKAPENMQKKDVPAVNFFSSNNLTFSNLVSEGSQQEAFKKDPNFSFADAGSLVFGSTSVKTNLLKTENKKKESCEKEDNEGEYNENDDDHEEHDPYFEPIIPLPETIEVRTGEEDEEKEFCRRAKLFRYDSNTKEWKERGVGEMKILHHVKNGTYRLLLRREQVHKVVCNFLLTPDIEFLPLRTSESSWVWGGMNYAEETPSPEKLAIRFKTSELAAEFKSVIDKVQQLLREKQSDQGAKCSSNDDGDDYDEDDECDEEDDEDGDDDEYNKEEDYDVDVNDGGDDKDEDDYDNDDEGTIFEKRVTLLTKMNEETEWRYKVLGTLTIFCGSNICDRRIIFKDDQSKHMSITFISTDIGLQINGRECIWTTLDRTTEPLIKLTLKAIFSSKESANQMYKIYTNVLHDMKKNDVNE